MENEGSSADAFIAELRDGVLWIRWHEHTSVSDDTAAALVARAEALAPGTPPPMLVELNGMVTLTRSALHQFATTLKVSAMAVVGPTAVDKALFTFFAEVHRPPYPTHHCETLEQGLAWLSHLPRPPAGPAPDVPSTSTRSTAGE